VALLFAVELVASVVFEPSGFCRLCRFNAAVWPFAEVSFAAGPKPVFGEGAAWLGKQNPNVPDISAAANNPRAIAISITRQQMNFL